MKASVIFNVFCLMVALSKAATLKSSSSSNTPEMTMELLDQVPSTTTGLGPPGPEVSSPLHVAQCRATCLQKIPSQRVPSSSSSSSGDGCSQDPECFTCWRNCELLEKLSQWIKSEPANNKSNNNKKSKSVAAICSTSQCMFGCQIACQFYSSLLQEPPSAVVATRRESVLGISGGGKVHWPKKQQSLSNQIGPDDQVPLVYVLIQQLPQEKWRTVIQTTENYAELPKYLWEKMDVGLRNVRVLVVSPKGLESIYLPAQKVVPSTTTTSTSTTTTTSSPKKVNVIKTTTGKDHEEGEEMEKTWSKMMKVDENYPPMHEEEEGAPESPDQAPKQGIKEEEVVEEEEVDLWQLRRLSLIHQKSLVIAELSWNAVKFSEDQEYLITWELDGGGLKGHLVTDSTTVSLSLWPDTLYHIQVELFEPNFEEGESDSSLIPLPSSSSSSSSRSRALIVDTSGAAFPLLQKPSPLSTSLHSSSEGLFEFEGSSALLAGMVGLVFVVFALLFVLSLRRLVFLQRNKGGGGGPLLFSSSGMGRQQLLEDTDDLVEERRNKSPFRLPRPPTLFSSSSCKEQSHGDSSSCKPVAVAVICGSSGSLNDPSSSSYPHMNPPQPRYLEVWSSSSSSGGTRGLGPWWYNNNSPQRAPAGASACP